MTKGKIASQASHASYSSLRKCPDNILKKWESEGQKKVVLKTSSEKDILSIGEKCRQNKIPFSIVKDAGKTQIIPGTVTSIGIGPWDEIEIDKITKELKLL